jgi:hypothetical protein
MWIIPAASPMLGAGQRKMKNQKPKLLIQGPKLSRQRRRASWESRLNQGSGHLDSRVKPGNDGAIG